MSFQRLDKMVPRDTDTREYLGVCEVSSLGTLAYARVLVLIIRSGLLPDLRCNGLVVFGPVCVS